MPDGSGMTPTVTVAVDETRWMPVGEIVYVQGWGWMQVSAVVDSTHVTLLNLEDGSGVYDTNSPAGTALAASAIIAPGGMQGVAGSVDTSLFLLKANNLSDLADTATSRTNLGLGSVATYNKGMGNGEVPVVDDVSGLGANEFVISNGTGLEGYDATAAGVLLGLGSAAYKDAAAGDGDVPFIDDVAGLNSGECVFVTGSGGLEGLNAADARAALGISGNTFDMLLFRQINVSGVFASGGWSVIPINTKVIDTGSHGSISGNDMTLDAGTYRYNYVLVASNCNAFRGRLYDTTAGALIGNSYSSQGNTNGSGGGFDNTSAFGSGRFTLAVASVIQLQGICETNGTFGTAHGGFAIDEYYSYITLEKE